MSFEVNMLIYYIESRLIDRREYISRSWIVRGNSSNNNNNNSKNEKKKIYILCFMLLKNHL